MVWNLLKWCDSQLWKHRREKKQQSRDTYHFYLNKQTAPWTYYSVNKQKDKQSVLTSTSNWWINKIRCIIMAKMEYVRKGWLWIWDIPTEKCIKQTYNGTKESSPVVPLLSWHKSKHLEIPNKKALKSPSHTETALLQLQL